MVAIADESACANVPVAGAATRWAGDPMEIIAADPAIIRADRLSARTGAAFAHCGDCSPSRSTPGHKGATRDGGRDRLRTIGRRRGYPDQAQFTRDFTAIAGITPAGYHSLGTTEPPTPNADMNL